MPVKKISKVLLINPPSIVKKSWANKIGTFPLGLAQIAAVLRKNGFETRIIGCFIEGTHIRQDIGNDLIRIGLDDARIITAVTDWAPDMVGISVPFSCLFDSALNVNALVKGVNPDIITVAGGTHITAAPYSVRPGTFDWLVTGEGEYALLRLIETINKEECDKPMPAVVQPGQRLPEGAECQSPQLIQDLDALPMPAYDLLALEKYWCRSGVRWINMIATRGCPHECVFCSIHTLMGRKIRFRSVENILAEIRYLRDEFSIERINFEDDNITASPRWAKRLFDMISRQVPGIEICFRNGIRADTIDGELMLLMRKAGVKQVSFAPESGSQKTLDNIIKKRMKLENVERAVSIAKRAGMNVTCFLIIGFPQETMDDVNETIAYGRKLKKIGCDGIWISCAVPYPGTELFEQCIERGILREADFDYQGLSTMDSLIANEWFSRDEIKTIRDTAMIQLNRTPSWRHITRRCNRVLSLLATGPTEFAGKAVRVLRKQGCK